MNFIQSIQKKIYSWKNDFVPYYERENGFIRITIIHSIAAFVLLPLFSFLIRDYQDIRIYIYFALSYTVLFPFYFLISWKIKYFKYKLVYFFIFHVFCITGFAFYNLISQQFNVLELIMFFTLFNVSLISIQRWNSLLLYVLFVFFLFLYVFYNDQYLLPFQNIFLAELLIISISALFVLYFRINILKNVKDYSRYLRSVIKSSGSGYLIFDLNKDQRVIDFNDKIGQLFFLKETTNSSVKEVIFSYFKEEELKKIKELIVGESFKKKIKVNKNGRPIIIEISVSVLLLKNNHFWLALLNDITDDISKRKEIELSERKYQNLYEKNRAGVFTLDLDSKIIKGNSSFYKMLDNIYKEGYYLFSKNQQKEWKIILESLGESNYSQNYQTQFSLSNGIEKTFIFNWYIDVEMNQIEGSVIDLTKIQKTTLALKQSEEKYRLIFEETNDAILFLDEDKIIDCNRKSIQLFGLTQEDLLTKNLFDLSLKTDSKTKEEYLSIRDENSRSLKFDWLFTGNGRKIEANVVIIEVVLNQKLYYQCVIHDTTSKNKYIRSIENNQRNLKNILLNHPEGIIICYDFKILFSNPEIHKIFGKDIEIKSIFKGENLENFTKVYEEHIHDRERKNIQVLFLDANNQEIKMDITLVSTVYEKNDAVLIIFKDISIQHKIDREIVRAELAEETNVKLAHEIKERIIAEQQLEDQFLRMKAILDSSSNTFLLTLTLDSNISSYNTHCRAYFSTILRDKILKGKSFFNYFDKVLSPIQLRFFKMVFLQVKKGRSKQFELDIDVNGIHHWMEVFVNPIFNTEGKVSEISLVAHDISEKKKASIEIVSSLKEKEILLKEIHHRVKNNLQVISSILNLQSSFITDDKILSILQESRNRVRTMAIIHENLYRTEDFSSINFSEYLDNLMGNLISSYRVNQHILLIKDLENVDLILDQAIPTGLIVNEIISNSLKYAWGENKKGKITISLKEKNEVVFLEISDNGIGLPGKFEDIQTETLGLQLVATLIEQLDGDIKTENENGTKYFIKFDKINP